MRKQQFLGLVGLGQIIVDARLQPAHPVARLAARGQHEDGDVGGFAQDSAKSKPFSPGIITSSTTMSIGQARQPRARLGGRSDGADAIAVAAQIRGDKLAQAPVVVDDQHMRRVVLGRGHAQPPPISAATRGRASASIICCRKALAPGLASGPSACMAASKRRVCARARSSARSAPLASPATGAGGDPARPPASR